MEKSKHSPGPWRINGQVIYAEESNGYVCTWSGNSANANLIKASPKMFTALQKIHAWLVCAAIASPEDMAESFPEMERLAAEALNEAKGEQ